MRQIFTPRDMLFPDGNLNPEYFKPKQKSVIIRKWTNLERLKLIKGIEKYGIGSWTQIRQEFLPAWEIGEIRIKTSRLIGRQSLAEYIEAVWKGDETMIEMEYLRNRKIGLSLNAWKGGVLVNDENGHVKQKLESEAYEPAYLEYVARRASAPQVEPGAEAGLMEVVGQRVAVWFSDVKQYFCGLITAKGEGAEKYWILWDSDAGQPGAQPDEVTLSAKDRTTSAANAERWCWETELQILTRRPRKAQFGTVAGDLNQLPLPLNSPLALAPAKPTPKAKRSKSRKSRSKLSLSRIGPDEYDDDEDYQ
jgi:hypothetical protein